MPRADWMLTSLLSIDLNVFPPFLCFIVQFIKCKPYSITNLPKIKILFQINKPINKIQLTHISLKEWNFLVVRSTSLNILIVVVVRWFPSKKLAIICLISPIICWLFSWNCWFSSWASSRNLRNSALVSTMLLTSLLWWSPSHRLAIKPRYVKALIPTNVAEAWKKRTQCSF